MRFFFSKAYCTLKGMNWSNSSKKTRTSCQKTFAWTFWRVAVRKRKKSAGILNSFKLQFWPFCLFSLILSRKVYFTSKQTHWSNSSKRTAATASIPVTTVTKNSIQRMSALPQETRTNYQTMSVRTFWEVTVQRPKKSAGSRTVSEFTFYSAKFVAFRWC